MKNINLIVFDSSTGTSLPLAGEIDVPPYRFVTGPPDANGSTNGCGGCAFRKRAEIRCSRIPCQRHPGQVAQLIEQPGFGP